MLLQIKATLTNPISIRMSSSEVSMAHGSKEPISNSNAPKYSILSASKRTDPSIDLALKDSILNILGKK